MDHHINVVMSEYLNNIDYCQKMTSVQVKYNAPVQLLHLSSKKFLSIPMSVEPNNMTNHISLELADVPSNSSIFKFLNVFKYQGTGTGSVFYQSDLKLCYSVGVDEVYAGVHFEYEE